MNYIDIKEAVKATGKSEKTIRRFLSNINSKPFLRKDNNKILIDVNYLFAAYPPVKNDQKDGSQNVVNDLVMTIDTEVEELKRKIALYEQEIKHKDELLTEKNGRIMDLQKAMLLLEAPKEQEQPATKKKHWWQF